MSDEKLEAIKHRNSTQWQEDFDGLIAMVEESRDELDLLKRDYDVAYDVYKIAQMALERIALDIAKPHPAQEEVKMLRAIAQTALEQMQKRLQQEVNS